MSKDIAVDNYQNYLFPVGVCIEGQKKGRNGFLKQENLVYEIGNVSTYQFLMNRPLFVDGELRDYFVVDVDTKNGNSNTYDALNAVKCFDNTLSVKTPSGGFHHYFYVPHNPLSSTITNLVLETSREDKVVLELITRCMGFGSMLNKEGGSYATSYQIINDMEIAKAPDMLLKLVATALEGDKKEVSNNYNSSSTLTESAKVGILEGLYQQSKVGTFHNREDWISVGKAMYNTGYTYENFEELSSHYGAQKDNLQSVWNSFESGNNATKGTLMFYLSQGQRMEVNALNNVSLETLGDKHENDIYGYKVFEVNEGSRELESRYSTITRPDKVSYLDCWTCYEYSKNSFDEKLRGYKYENGRKTNGEVKYSNLAEHWKDITQPFDDTIFIPIAQDVVRENGLRKINKYKEETRPYYDNEEIIQPFLDFTKEVICAGDDKKYEWLNKWIGFALQYPAQKHGTCPVIFGNPRTGKTFWVETIGKLFGRYFYKKSSENGILNFNADFEDKLLIHLEEAVFAKNPQIISIMKTFITDDRASFNAKHKQTEDDVPFYGKFIITTNETHRPAPMKEVDEGRYVLMRVSNKRKDDREYFAPLYAVRRKAEFLDALFTYYKNIDVEGFMKVKSLDTDEKLREQSEVWIEADYMNEWFFNAYDNDGVFGGDYLEAEKSLWDEDLTIADIVKDMLEFYKEKRKIGDFMRNNKSPNNKGVAAYLREFGLGYPKKKRINKVEKRVIAIEDKDDDCWGLIRRFIEMDK